MSKDWPPKIEKEIDNAYKLGISVGLEQASNLLLEIATMLFTTENDERATQLRAISKDLKNKSNVAHPNPSQGFHHG